MGSIPFFKMWLLNNKWLIRERIISFVSQFDVIHSGRVVTKIDKLLNSEVASFRLQTTEGMEKIDLFHNN